MERNFNNVDFENFLKENADQYRMYASEKTWKGIYNALNTRKRWFGIGFLFSLVAGGFATFFIINSRKTDLKELTHSNSPVQSFAVNEKNSKSQITLAKGISSSPDISDNAVEQAGNTPFRSKENKLIALVNSNFDAVDKKDNVTAFESIGNDTENELVASTIASQAEDQDFFVTGRNSKPSTTPANVTENLAGNPLTIESVVNSYHVRKKKNTVKWQIYFTPTISYRKLSENKAFLRAAPAPPNLPYNYAALYDINSVVTHKPDMGLELGLSAKYRITRILSMRAGLQFNVSRYEIKAFNYPVEIATISLNRGGSAIESVNTISTHRNFSGDAADWLKNFYFQVSVPLGAEVKIAGDDKVQFGIASTIQPTYVLGDRAYLISTDYKNYSEVPWLIRRWNVNTNLETYVAYSTGKLNWQVGPQVRYQLLSSFVNKYPVKENLFDFGLKVGIGLNK